MKSLPQNWRVRDGRDPEQEAHRLRKRFRQISRRYDRSMKLRRYLRSLKLLFGAVLLALALTWGLMSFSPWPLLTTLKHLAAFPNCTAARAVGLAPAYQGQPGYWQWNDEDRNGRACERRAGQQAQ
jgi:hypothetical protein